MNIEFIRQNHTISVKSHHATLARIACTAILLAIISVTNFSSRALAADEPTATTPATKPVPKPAVRKWNGNVYKTVNNVATITATLNPSEVAPGGKTKLTLTITPRDKNWYYYEYSPTSKNRGKSSNGLPVLLHLPKQNHISLSEPKASQSATEALDEKGLDYFYYDGATSFEYDITVSQQANEGDIVIEGMTRVQLCEKKKQCLPDEGIAYKVSLSVTKNPKSNAIANAEFAKIRSSEVLRAVKPITDDAAEPKAKKNSTVGKATFADLPEFEPVSTKIDSLYMAIGFGLIGGFILNFMPCVLPVIGLKVLSFVQQAGRQRGQIFMLNLFYTLGIIAVFLVLAALAIIFKKGWGEQNNNIVFNVTMISLVFAMALSFLGIWEIPIPGFASGGSLSQVATHEGYGGAFAKGIVTTLLATPCSGPFLGAVFAFTAKEGTTAASVLAVFFSIGLGMAFPYLMIGAFPKLVRFLPKPGHWMDTFKHLMGFMLLGTVVFLFWSLDRKYFMSMLTFMFALWFAFWWIGQVPVYEALAKRLKAWVVGGAVAAVIGWLAFTKLVEGKATDGLDWQEYSHANLLTAINEKKSVIVDFTADWCPTCQVNLGVVLNSAEVKKVVEEKGITPLVVEHTFHDELDIEGTELLRKAFKQNSIPMLAIFNADDPRRPILLNDVLTKDQVIGVLNKISGSKSAAPPAVTSSSEKEGFTPTAMTEGSK